MAIDQTEVIGRVARRIGMTIPQVERVIDAYAAEWIAADRADRTTKAQTEAPAKPARAPRKAAKGKAQGGEPQPNSDAGSEAQAAGSPT